MIAKKHKQTQRNLSTDSIPPRYAEKKTVDFYIPETMCSNCQYRKETLINREVQRAAHIPLPPDIKAKVKHEKKIEKLTLEKRGDRLTFGYMWNKLMVRFMSKRFQKPFTFILYNHYYSKESEYVSIFNLFTEVIKKDANYAYFLRNVEKPKPDEAEKKKLLDEIKEDIIPPPDGMMKSFKDSASFTAYSELTKQDKAINKISDEI